MSSFPLSQTSNDCLLTPENTAWLVIDYQPAQIRSVRSIDRAYLISRIVSLARLSAIYRLPTVLSTVHRAEEDTDDTIPVLRRELGDIPSYRRTAINAWEDRDFRQAVQATGRKNLLITALWTESSLTFSTLDALAEGFGVYPVVDAVGGTSLRAHKAALHRMERAGATPTTFAQLCCELQRDWSRTATAGHLIRLFKEIGIFPDTA